MERHERTFWGFVFSLIVMAILGASLALPWFHYEYSSGVKTPPGGPQPVEDKRITREEFTVYAFRTEGHSNNTTAAQVDQTVRTLGWLVGGSIIALFLVAALEVPVPFPISTRWITLTLVPIGFLLAVSALVYGWVAVPDLLTTAGVDGPFTAKQTPDGYIRTQLLWGWPVVLAACFVYPGVFLLKYQAGGTDPTVIETYRQQKAS